MLINIAFGLASTILIQMFTVGPTEPKKPLKDVILTHEECGYLIGRINIVARNNSIHSTGTLVKSRINSRVYNLIELIILQLYLIFFLSNFCI